VNDQINATNQPIAVHPSRTVRTRIAVADACPRENAIIGGRKYKKIKNNGKPAMSVAPQFQREQKIAHSDLRVKRASFACRNASKQPVRKIGIYPAKKLDTGFIP
jgi:hypothetical protein